MLYGLDYNQLMLTVATLVMTGYLPKDLIMERLINIYRMRNASAGVAVSMAINHHNLFVFLLMSELTLLIFTS